MNNEIDYSSFQRTKNLGKGSYGSVYQIENKEKNIKLALKVLELVNGADEKYITREIEILELIKKEKIKPECFSYYKGYYIVQEHERKSYNIVMDLKSSNLRNLIENAKKNKEIISVKVIYSIFKQLIGTMAYLESLDIAHRDLKPDNILIEETSNHKFKTFLVDFGISKKLISNSIKNTTVLGTYSYFSPELHISKIKNEKNNESKKFKINSIKSDVYSLALIILELLSKKKMEFYNFKNKDEVQFFFEEQIDEIMEKILNDYDNFKSDKLTKILKITRKMLNFDVENRPNFCDLIFKFINKKNIKILSILTLDKQKLLNGIDTEKIIQISKENDRKEEIIQKKNKEIEKKGKEIEFLKESIETLKNNASNLSIINIGLKNEIEKLEGFMF